MENFKAHEHVKNYIRENKINKSSLARALKLSEGGIKGQTETCNMRVDVLAELCAVLKYNFFADFAQEFPDDYDKKVTDERDKLIKELELEVMMLKREKEMLTNIIRER